MQTLFVHGMVGPIKQYSKEKWWYYQKREVKSYCCNVDASTEKSPDAESDQEVDESNIELELEEGENENYNLTKETVL